MQYQWAEDDFDLPYGVPRLGASEPVSGQRYVMYHGTTRKSAQTIVATGFHQSEDGMLGRGVYLSRDLQKASRYPIRHPESDKVVIKVMVNVGKVIAIKYQGHPRQKTWHDHGYDTAWVPPMCGMVKSGLEEDCVWDPNRIQIISTINPQPAPPCSGYGAWGYRCAAPSLLAATAESDWQQLQSIIGQLQLLYLKSFVENRSCKNRSRKDRFLYNSESSLPGNSDANMQYQWAEDDFDLPYGVGRLGASEPVSGQRYIMYHGTTRRSAQTIVATGFRQSEDGMLGRGVYLSRDLQKASRYPIGHPESDKIVIKVVVNVGKVIAIKYQGHPHQKTWHDYGYDTAWVPPMCGMVKSGLEENCVWDPNRIQIIKTIRPRPVQHQDQAPGFEALGFAALGAALLSGLFLILGRN
ncbi:uncharacterized protein ABDE67_012596 [Symphorus nematophorus]